MNFNLFEKQKCSICQKEIEKGEPIILTMRYPMYKGNTEITAYLKNESTVFCKNCAEIKKID